MIKNSREILEMVLAGIKYCLVITRLFDLTMLSIAVTCQNVVFGTNFAVGIARDIILPNYKSPNLQAEVEFLKKPIRYSASIRNTAGWV